MGIYNNNLVKSTGKSIRNNNDGTVTIFNDYVVYTGGYKYEYPDSTSYTKSESASVKVFYAG